MIYDKQTSKIREKCDRCGGAGFVVSPYDPTDSGNCPECNKTGYVETACHHSCKELWEDGKDYKEGVDYTINKTEDGEHWQDYHTVEIAYPITSQFDIIKIAAECYERYKPNIIPAQKTPANMFKLGAQAILIQYEKQINPTPIQEESEDEVWDDFADYYAYIVTKEPDIKLPEVVEYFKQSFTIKRKV